MAQLKYKSLYGDQINVKLLISIQTLIFQFSHRPPLLTLRFGVPVVTPPILEFPFVVRTGPERKLAQDSSIFYYFPLTFP